MPSLAPFHPQVVHFAIALLIVGVALRWVSLTGRAAFASPAAVVLIVTGTFAAFAAVNSGEAAHSPVEQVPGSREVVLDHEAWGQRTAYVFAAVAALEVLVLATQRRRAGSAVALLSAVLGVGGLYYLYGAAERGGRLVYSHAGGVGIRTGDPVDVRRLLLAGLYQQAQLDRKTGDRDAAARLFEEAGRRFPDDIEVQLLAAESLLLDRRDPAAALGAVAAINPAKEYLRVRKAVLAADALDAAGRPDEARAALETLLKDLPNNRQLRARLEKSRK
jgi:uncharacterized membrane protein